MTESLEDTFISDHYEEYFWTGILNIIWSNPVICVALVAGATDLGFDIFFW